MAGRRSTTRGDYDRAIADYTEVLRLQPKAATAYNNRGLAYYQKREYDRAVADYTEAIRIDAKFARAYFNRSLAYRRQGETALGRLTTSRQSDSTRRWAASERYLPRSHALRGNARARRSASRPLADRTRRRASPTCVPTQSVGTRSN